MEILDNAAMVYQGDALKVLKSPPDRSVECCVTSPPYWGLRDYGGVEGQIGLERSPDEYVARLVTIFDSTTMCRCPSALFSPESLITPCVLAGCPTGGTVLDPFCGSGTTLLAALHNACDGIGIELNKDYLPIIERRLDGFEVLFL